MLKKLFNKTQVTLVVSTAIMTFMSGAPVFADDGELVRKSMSQNIADPDLNVVSEAEHAFIDTMKFYVPAQASNGDSQYRAASRFSDKLSGE